MLKEDVARTNATISEDAIRARAVRAVAMPRVTEMSLAMLRAATVGHAVNGGIAAMVRPAARGLAAMLK